MVAGAAALIQSIVKARGLPPLRPQQLRSLLVMTGSPQGGDISRNIGPRPNLRAAIDLLDSLEPGLPPRINSLAYNANKGRLIVDGERFIPLDSIIEINGARIPKHKYPVGFWMPDGTTTRIMSKGDISAILPRGVLVAVTVFNQSTGLRSEPIPFRRL
jgi:hypothetical protein